MLNRAGKYLAVAGGEPSYNLLKIVRPELRFELRNALYQAAQNRRSVETRGLQILDGEKTRIINLVVRPILLEGDGAARGFLLVLFEETEETDGAKRTAAQMISLDEPTLQLEAELGQIRGQLMMTIDQYETQTEELKASNEELQAMNEELRSATEELETGKEELQSINEELQTVNQELKIKIEELSQANNDFQNLMFSTDIGTLFLDRRLRVKFFTPRTLDVFNLIPTDIGRPLSDITSKIADADLLTEAEAVIARLQNIEREVTTHEGRCYMMRVLPYRTTEDRIDGVIVTFLEITERKNHEEELKLIARQLEQQTRIFDTTLSAISDFAYLFDRDGHFVYSNQPLLDLLGITLEEIKGKNFFDLNYPEDLAARLQKQIQKVFDTKKLVRDETPFTSPAGEPGFYEYIFTPVFTADGSVVEVVAGSTRDVTTRKKIESELRESEANFRQLAEAVPQLIWVTETDGSLSFVNEKWKKFSGLTLAQTDDNETLSVLFHPEDRERVFNKWQKAFADGGNFEIELRMQNGNGEYRWFLTRSQPVRDEAGKIIRWFGTSTDITTRKQFEEDLLESEERLRLLIESAKDYAIITVNTNCEIDSWNVGAQGIFGYTEAEIIGEHCDILFTPEDRAALVPIKEIETAREKGAAEDERWHLRKDGSRFYVSGMMRQLRDSKGELHGFVKIARDMTEQIKTRDELRAAHEGLEIKVLERTSELAEANNSLQSEITERERNEKHRAKLLQKLVTSQEDERQRISRELHDHLGQQLTALRLNLESIRERYEDNEELHEKISQIQAIATRLDADVDFLAWELRPAALDELGLTAALENYIKEWSLHFNIPAEFHADGLKTIIFGSAIEINLYRIVQEALNNVSKYARAKQANVILKRRAKMITLIIEDDGVGFDIKKATTLVKGKGLGLIGMRERTTLMGGTMEIESVIGQGTTIFVIVPLAAEDEEMKRKEDGEMGAV